MSEIRKTILVVNDKDNIVQIVRQTLEEAGYAVVTAVDGPEALDKISQLDISLVLLDITMSQLDGLSTRALLRKQSSVPVIMMAASGEATCLRDAFALSFGIGSISYQCILTGHHLKLLTLIAYTSGRL